MFDKLEALTNPSKYTYKKHTKNYGSLFTERIGLEAYMAAKKGHEVSGKLRSDVFDSARGDLIVFYAFRVAIVFFFAFLISITLITTVFFILPPRWLIGIYAIIAFILSFVLWSAYLEHLNSLVDGSWRSIAKQLGEDYS